MIPTLILFLLRRYRRHHPLSAKRILAITGKWGKVLGLLVVCLIICFLATSQEKKWQYRILRNGEEVGSVHVVQLISGSRTIFKLESEVNTRFIFRFTARIKEEAIYDNGILTWSSIYRQMNGKVKADKKTKVNGTAYTVYKGEKSETISGYPIRYNMLSIYSTEPVNMLQVYSDNFQKMLPILPTGRHCYKINFPDGSYNEYFYTDGNCSKIEIYHSFYRATILLKP